MSRHILIATFRREEDLLDAARRLRRRGLAILDAYTPYPVHGLDELLGVPPSRLTWVCAILGAVGAGLMFWFQIWTSATDWPVNVGGKPLHSLPAFVPVVFESMVLAAGIGTALAFFAVTRLLPGRKPHFAAMRVTDDRFALVLEQTDATFGAEELQGILTQSGALHVEQRIAQGDGDAAVSSKIEQSRRPYRAVNLFLALLLAVAVAAAYAASGNSSKRGWELLPNMVWSPAYDAYALAANKAGAAVSQGPPPGIVARDETPLHYANTEEDAVRAGKELMNPFAPGNPGDLARGTFVFENFCASCHGQAGVGDGPVAQRGYPPPPNLATGNSRTMPDGQLFHILTFGRRNMPSHAHLLDTDDRWKVILHVRKLQSEFQPTKEETP